MSHFPLFEKNTAPAESVEWLEKAEQNFNMIPNIEKVMALTPQLLAAYTFMWDGFNTTTLNEQERQVIYMTANFENECNYCVPWHTLLSKKANISQDDVAALRSGAPLSDSKLNALRNFTRTLIANRGKASEAELQGFFEAGYSDKQALEVILGLAIKLISNYTNSIAGTPLDPEVEDLRWRKPLIRERKSD